MRRIAMLGMALLGTLTAAAGAEMPSKAVLEAAVAAAAKAPSGQAKGFVMKRPARAGVLPYTGLEMGLVAGGYAAEGLPCFGCANTGGGWDVSIPIPITRTSVGTYFRFSMLMNSDSYTGACSTAYVLIPAAGGSPVRGGNLVWPDGCGPNSTYLVYFDTVLDIPAGDYHLVGIAFGTGGTTDKMISALHLE